MNRHAVPILFVVTFLGLIISLLAHISTFFGVKPDMGFMGIWVFIIIFFIVWPETSLDKNKLLHSHLTDIWTFVTVNSPKWVKWIYRIMICYVLVNLLFWAFGKHSFRELYEVRMVTGYCSGFYFMAVVAFLQVMRKERI